MKRRPFWFLLDIYAWIVFILGVVTTLITKQWWVLLLAVIGYLVVIIVQLLGGRSLGRTGAIRLARVEQENRELRAEQARLLGAIREYEGKLKKTGELVEVFEEPTAAEEEKNEDEIPDPL